MALPRNAFLSGAAALLLTTLPGLAGAETPEIVLVHGANMDGSAWRAVYDRLTADGYEVAVVQLPLTSVEADVAATRRVLETVTGPVVLVGHSYGGFVISQAGVDPDVKALVYVAAFLPDRGETIATLSATAPSKLSPEVMRIFPDGHYLIGREAWIADVATGLPDADARFTADAQTASNTVIFSYQATDAAGQTVPAWSVVATDDRIISPELQRRMSARADATVVEMDGGHLLPMTRSAEVAKVIEEAAASIE